MVTVKGRKSSNKNPPIFSHDFIIQNHADIVSCIAMVFVIGLMIQVTSPWAYIFIALQHNISAIDQQQETDVHWQFATGWKDYCAVFFYFLIVIVMHAVIQEYILDKISKRLHLSKVKLSKFNESSQLAVFFTLSAIWGIDIIIRDNLVLGVHSLWESYPLFMSFSMKLFFIIQLAYWLHCYPELYFQKIKKEEIGAKVFQATVGLFFTLTAYFFNFQHITVMLLVCHYIGDLFQHGARLMHIVYRKEHITRVAFLIANFIYVLVRVLTVIGAATFYIYGLSKVQSLLDYSIGNFNAPVVRFSAFGLVLLFQAYLLYDFMKRQSLRTKDSSTSSVTAVKAKSKQQKLKKKENKKSMTSEDDDLPEVDQATKKNLRSRSAIKTK
ncbi:translocating chain-associated membrane protein 1 [Chelonus insularis]|uniref:translocating chain-associated membrane protein 1 n=1 Tax=Chelonus insularis TaxID=460826 RepID=UPI00158AB763|nr:translocating chain-associated membrane protein 1 [Chelonus insularis]